MSDDREGPWHTHCFQVVMRLQREKIERNEVEFIEALETQSGVSGWRFEEDRGFQYPSVPDGWVSPWCYVTLDCGGYCHLPPSHEGPHLCGGDIDGPGSCPG